MPSVPLQNEKMSRFIENCYHAYSSTLVPPSSHQKKEKNVFLSACKLSLEGICRAVARASQGGMRSESVHCQIWDAAPLFLPFQPAVSQENAVREGKLRINKHTNVHEGYWCVKVAAKKNKKHGFSEEQSFIWVSKESDRKRSQMVLPPAAAPADGRLIWDAVWTRSTSSLSSVPWTL